MATRTRETAPGKEKRGTSPSYPKKTPNSKQSSPEKSASDKNVPNYLKPTISSRLDASKQFGKKPSSTHNANKPNLARRRSLDKPPSPSGTQKTRLSSSPTIRSSSSSSKPMTTTHKSIPDKLLKTPTKVAGKRFFIAKPLSTTKKGSPSNKKQDTAKSGSITIEQVTSPDKSDALQVEIGQDEHESSVTDAEYEETVHELGPENLVVENEEPISITRQAEPENITDEDVVTIESYTVSEQPEVSLGVETKELPEDEPKIELEEHTLNENNHTQTDEILEDNSKAEVEVEVEVEVEEKEVAIALDGSETADSEEQEMKEVDEEVKPETENEESKQEDSEKKKESPVSNDVIEETASKLREQRKNKVKALAGAFETVISLQEPK